MKQLILFGPTNKSFSDILLTAKNLQKINIVATPDGVNAPLPFIRSNDVKNIMKKLITSCKLLEYIRLFVYFSVGTEWIVSMLNGIEKGLFETKQWKRNRMKIQTTVACDNNFNPNDFIANIGKIIHLLDCSNIKDFMFTWKLKSFKNKTDINKILQELKSKRLSINVQIYVIGKRFVISNSNCKIDGLIESYVLTVSMIVWLIVS